MVEERLYLVTIGVLIGGRRVTERDYKLYVLAEDEKDASEKASRYDNSSFNFVDNIEFIADEKGTNKTVLVR